jgi:2-hydroxychromene-2-carboxylate isomerase
MTTPPRPRIEFWFEFASTYSYPAAMRVERVAAEHGCDVSHKPFLLGPIFRGQGWNDSPFIIFPAKGRYMWRDLARVCEELGLPLQKPTQFPRNGLLAARIVCAAHGESWQSAFVRNTYTANFARDQDIADREVLRECLESLVAEPEHWLQKAETVEVKARLRAHSDRAVELGIFGAPSFVVGDELFWGNDRLESALRWATRPQR